MYCGELISNTYSINLKLIFKQLPLYCYEHKIKEPRLRLNYKTKEMNFIIIEGFKL